MQRRESPTPGPLPTAVERGSRKRCAARTLLCQQCRDAKSHRTVKLPLSIAMGRGPGVGLSSDVEDVPEMPHPWVPGADKVVALDALLAALEPRRAAGQQIALTNGTFDLIHVGHLRSLEQ